MESKQKKERSLKDFVDILLPKLWIIAVVSVVLAVLAFVYSTTRVDTYTSSYAPNRLTVVEYYPALIYARDLLCDYISAGNFE